MQKVTPFLWFNDNAEEAINYYTSIFKDSSVGTLRYYGDAGAGKKGSVMGGSFTIGGQHIMVLNGGPHYSFTPAISLYINCETQEEVDDLWEKLSAGGEKSRCGWLKDKYGLSWQVIPSALGRMLQDKDLIKVGRVMQAMMKMTKIDIRDLEAAYNAE